MVNLSSILLPLYIYPRPGVWNWVNTAVAAYPSVDFNIIVNPHNGPGPVNTFPDTNYIDGIASLNAFGNVNLLGYVDTTYMHRTTQEIAAEVDTYAFWSTYTAKDIHVSGIFFDQCISNWNTTTSAWMSTIATHTHSKGFTVTFNPGVIADPAFFNIADHILMLENAYDAPKALASVNAIPTNQRAKSTAMFHHFTGTATEQASLVKSIATAGIGSLYITTVDYDGESALWKEFVFAVNAGKALKL